MSSLIADLEQHLEADDGVVEVERIMPHLSVPWASLKPGPRRWAPTDLSVEVEDNTIALVRLTYRTVGDRAVVVAGAAAGTDVDWLAERIATPLLFAHFRKRNPGAQPRTIMASMKCEARWEKTPGDGWLFGEAGVGPRPVRLARRDEDGGFLVVAAHGVASEELTTMLATMDPLTPGSAAAQDLHVRHRRALAQRWWDAPRAPWTPKD